MYRLYHLGFLSATLIIPLISPLHIAVTPLETEALQAQTTSETQVNTYRRLQKNLISQKKYEEALLIAERSQGRALVELVPSRNWRNRVSGLAEPNQIVNPPSIEQIKQIAKQQNATLVQYSIIYDEVPVNSQRQTKESELYIWVIQPTGEIKFRQVDLKSLLQKENTSLKNLIASTRDAIGVSTRVKGLFIEKMIKEETQPPEKFQKLHQLLIAPIADLLPKNPNEKVIFVPQEALFLVPFPALQDASGKYLIEQHAISTSPSIQVLDLVHSSRQRQTNTKDVLIVGNPEASLPPKLGEPPQRLSPLPGAEEEAKAVASIFNTQALTGKQATKATVLERMPSARIIHLATHTCLDDVQGLGSFIALSPSGNDNGVLTAEEILNLKLNAELVVLSGGDSANGRITGDGVIGLPRAFISTGVRSVVGSLWNISDRETVLLMTEFYKNLQENPGNKSQALQKAMVTMKKKYPNPRYWAAFTLIGDS